MSNEKDQQEKAMNYFDSITEILRSAEPDNRLKGENNILPTALYNEGWLLRLILHWFSKNRGTDFPVSFNSEARWFSEGRLETIFKAEKGQKIGESYTETDGMYGNFTVGTQGALNRENARGISDIRPERQCRQFVAIEAKMFSGFSKGVTNAGEYPQTARYAACMSYVLYKAKINVNNIDDLAFYAFLPESHKRKNQFKAVLQKEQIEKAVKKRVEQYKRHDTYSHKIKWFNEAFKPFLEKVSIKPISWEEILEFIKGADKESYKMLNEFYSQCKSCNGLKPGDSVDTKLLG